MTDILDQKLGRFVASQRIAAPCAVRKIDPRLVIVVVRLLDWLVLASAGMVAVLAEPTLFAEPLAVTAGFIATTIVLLTLALAEFRPLSISDYLRQPPLARLADASWRVLLPFALSLMLALVLFNGAGTGPREPLLDWLRIWGLATFIGIASIRIVLSVVLRQWRAKGRLKQTIAVVGTGDLAERLIQWLRVSCGETVELIGVFDDRGAGRIDNAGQRSLWRGTIADLIELAKDVDVDRVIIALPHAAQQRLLAILGQLRMMPVDISLAPDLIGYAASIKRGGEYDGLPLINVHGRALAFGQNLLKTLIDRLLAAAALALLWPVLAAAALAIRFDSPGPVCFCQNRFGFGNKVIRVYKLRTMRADTADEVGLRQVEIDDPRITRVGRLLRRSSIDELPQLWNVLKGEMSLVGPRPLAVQMRVEDKLNREIISEYARRHHIKPGVTGWAQVHGHVGRVATAEALRSRVSHDLYYIDNWSLWLDLQILFATFKVVFRRRDCF